MTQRRMPLILAALAAGCAPALADGYFFRAKPMVSPPRPFAFTDASDVDPGDPAISGATEVRGYKGATATVSGDAGAAYQVCSLPDCSDQGVTWRTEPTSKLPDAFYVRMKVSPATFGGTASAHLSVGGASATFGATTRARDVVADPIQDFQPATDVEAGTSQVSSTRRLAGHDGVGVSISGAGAQYRICASEGCVDRQADAGWTSTPGEAARDTHVQLRVAAPSGGNAVTVRLAYGAQSASWDVSSKTSVSPVYTAMGFTNPGLNAALAAALGTSPWTLCKTDNGAESCSGASETLIVHKHGGVTFGVYTKGNVLRTTQCWTTSEGFYFTDTTGFPAYLVNKYGAPATSGEIDTCGTTYNSHLHIGPIAYASATATIQYGTNGFTWGVGRTLSGTDGNPNTTVHTTLRIYKR